MLRRDCDHVRLGRRAPCLRAFMAVALACCLAPAGAALARAPGAAPSYRIFLNDGTPIVSFGEFARANGRVVFAVPIGSPANPDTIQVVSLPDSVVDWDRTDRYTDAVRHQFYASTRGEDDYAALTGAVARALGEIAFVGDPGSKLAIAADLRRQLLEWPAAHFGYRIRRRPRTDGAGGGSDLRHPGRIGPAHVRPQPRRDGRGSLGTAAAGAPDEGRARLRDGGRPDDRQPPRAPHAAGEHRRGPRPEQAARAPGLVFDDTEGAGRKHQARTSGRSRVRRPGVAHAARREQARSGRRRGGARTPRP